jgi:glutathione S-transferase
MKLYYSPGACSFASHIILEETGLKYDIEKVDLKSHRLANGEDYSKVNPKNQVPALMTDDGQLLTEGAIIMQYICDQKPEKKLLPQWGTFERYRANEWLNYIATEIHKGLSALFAADRWVKDKTANEQFRIAIKEGLAKKFEYLDQHLQNNNFILGSQFSPADAYLFTVLNWHKFLQVDLSPFKNLLGFMERVHQRPAVQKALRAESPAH